MRLSSRGDSTAGVFLAEASKLTASGDLMTQAVTRLIDTLPCPVAAVRDDGQVLTANPAWRRSLHAGGADGNGKRLGDLFPAAANAAAEVLRSDGGVARRAVPLAHGLSASATWWDLHLARHPDAADLVLVTAHDVTELVLARREAEEAREALEPIGSRLRLAQEAAGIGTWEWDAAADRQAWSPQQFRVYGLDPAGAVPPSFDEWVAMIVPEDRPRIHPRREFGFDGRAGSGFQTEFRIRRADTGAIRWLLSVARVMQTGPDGRLRRVMGVNIDITERRNEQEALRQSEALLRLASEAAGVHAWDWDIASGRVRWAEGLEEALGLPRGGFGSTVDAFRALVHPDDAPAVEAALRRAMDGETAGYRATFRMFRGDGSVRWTETRGMVLRDGSGRPVRFVGMDHDITEQKAVEAALHEREAQQAAVARLGQFALEATSSLAVMDTATRILTETLGVELAEVLELQPGAGDLLLRAGSGVPDAYPLGEAVVAADGRTHAGYTLLLGPEPVVVDDLRAETRFAGASWLRDLGVVSGLSVVIPGCDSSALPYGVLGVHTRSRRRFNEHDIRCLEAVANIIAAAVQRERADAALLERKARLWLFIERAPAAIAMFDADMRYMAVSRRFISDYGLPFESPAELEGRLHYDVFPDLSGTWCAVHRCVVAGETHRAEEEPLVRPDGRTETVRWEMAPWHRADGSVGGALLFTEVITARKQAEAAVAESEARFRALADSIPQLVYVRAADGSNEYRNRRWFEYSGRTPEDTGDDGWIAMLHPDDREASVAAWVRAMATGEPFEREHRLLGRDGAYRWFLSRAIPWRAPDDGRIVRWVGTATDISEVVRARERAADSAASLEAQVADRTRALTEAAMELQAEMRRRQDMHSALMQSQKLEALGQLTAGVAHDFNNLLTAIQGSFELMGRRPLDPKMQELVGLGKDAAERASALTRQLLNFGRSEAVLPAELDVAAAIRRANEMIGHAVGSAISRELDLQPGVWPVLTDGHQLEVALLNLAINARDAMPNGGKLILSVRNLTERPEGLALKDYVCISVQDSGQGMPADVLARATEPFFTTKPEGKGTGLGLPMVHAFALRSGGYLRINSREGIGTIVQIILPRAPVTEMTHGDSAQARAAADDDGRSATILVVEDDEQVRQITGGFLRDQGFTVIEAANAEAAIVLSHSVGQLDLLLTDVAMPGAEGPALAERLRAERPEVPILFITGFGDRDDLAGEDVLLKPFTGPDLIRAINRRLARSEDGEPAHSGLLRRLKSPALVAAYLFWRAARNGGKPPRLIDLDWGGLPDTENSFVVAVEPAGESVEFRYIRVGRALVSRLGRPLNETSVTGPRSADPDDEVLGSLAGAYGRCAATLAPNCEYVRYNFGDGAPALFERLILPVSDDGNTVTHLCGVVLISGAV